MNKKTKKTRKTRIFSSIIASVFSLVTLMGFNAFAYDPNGDGYYDIFDVLLLSSFLAGNNTVSNLTPLDYNKNGVITSTDLEKLTDDLIYGPIDKSSPKGDNSSIPNHVFTETQRNYAVYDAITGNYKPYDNYSIDCSPIYDNSDVSTYSIIGDTDERVVDFSKSGVVKIIVHSDTEDKYHYGTGFIVGPHAIATVSHLVDDPGYRKKARVTNIIAFNSDGTQRSDTITPEEIHYCTSFGNNTNQEYYDYALITVKEDLSNYPIFELGVYDYMLDKDVAATITGFPGEIQDNSTGNLIRVNNENNLHTMYTGNGIVISSDGGKINHTIDATNGNSGSPLYITEYYNNTVKYVAFGIHNLGDEQNNQTNHAVQIDTNIIKFYKNNPHIPQS